MMNTNNATTPSGINFNSDQEASKQEPKIPVLTTDSDKLFDDDLESFIKEAKAKDLAELNAKIERERDAKLASEKRKKEIEKANLLSTKKWKADLRKRQQKEKEFYLRLKHTNYFCRISDFMDDLGLVNTTSSRVTHQLFDQFGKLIAKGDKLTHGKDGFFYTEDERDKKFELFRYDKESKKRQDLGCFNSESELFEHIAKADPIKTLGFTHYRMPKPSKPVEVKTPHVMIKTDRQKELDKKANGMSNYQLKKEIEAFFK